jgi:hypothetical protein
MLTVGGTFGAKLRVTLFFDKSTGLLSRSTFSYPTILGSMAQINDYSNYQKVGDLMIPMTIANHSPRGDAVQTYSSATVEKYDESIFNPSK